MVTFATQVYGISQVWERLLAAGDAHFHGTEMVATDEKNVIGVLVHGTLEVFFSASNRDQWSMMLTENMSLIKKNIF